MMDIQQLLDFRKITQAISHKFADDLNSHLETLAPLFAPQTLFGEAVRSGTKTTGLRGEKAYRELCNRFEQIAGKTPFNLTTHLGRPLDLFAATPVLNPVEYTYSASSGETTYRIKVTCPLKWTLSYPEATPNRIRELAAEDRDQPSDTLHHLLLQTLAMAILVEQHPGLVRLFGDLRFSLTTEQQEGLGALPFVSLTAPLATHRPEDEVLIQNTQLTGIPLFEEIVDIDQILDLSDPMRQQLLQLAEGVNPEILQEMAH